MAVLAALLLFFLVTPARADFPIGQDQAGWDRTAATAEFWLKASNSKKPALSLDQWGDLRLTLTLERELARTKADTGTLGTKILLAQLAALGPKPNGAASEDGWIAARRSQLNALLAKAEMPVQARAGVLIAEIDVIIARKNRAQLFARKHSLFEPALWIGLAHEIDGFPASFRRSAAGVAASGPGVQPHGGTAIVLTLPVVAMMWGVGIDTIVDWILALKNGVEIGQVRISFGNVMTFAFVFLIGYFMTRWLQRIVQLALFPRLHVDHGAKAAALTGVGYVGLTVSGMVAITAAGLDLSSLAFVAGALSVGIGFGLQSVVSNFVSGIILLIERPVKEGDWIEVGGIAGHVRRIAFRSTYIQTPDLHEVIIPNSQLVSGSVTNFSYGGSEGRISMPVGITYAADIDGARQVLLAVAASHSGVIAAPPPAVVMDGFGDSSVNLQLLCFVDDVNQRRHVKSDLYFAIFDALKRAGIEIPFPQRDIRIRDDSEGRSDTARKRVARRATPRNEDPA